LCSRVIEARFFAKAMGDLRKTPGRDGPVAGSSVSQRSGHLESTSEC